MSDRAPGTPSESRSLRVVVTGATGNVGTAVVRRLVGSGDPSARVVGLVRRPPTEPSGPAAAVDWVEADLSRPSSREALAAACAGADAVVHLAWAFQPARDREHLRALAVDGTARVAAAAVDAGVPHLVHMSSVGAYAPRTSATPVTEDWPTTGIPTSDYSQDKVAAEELLDDVERSHPELTVTRLRPGVIGNRAAGDALLRYGVPALVPRAAVRAVPLLPLDRDVVLPVVHADDVAEAVARALLTRAGGAFNLAAPPVLRPADLAAALGARHVHVPGGLVRSAGALAWRARLSRLEPGWIDLALQVPVMDTTRAFEVLGWLPRVSGPDALGEALAGIRRGADGGTPVLRPRSVAREVGARLAGRPTPHRERP